MDPTIIKHHRGEEPEKPPVKSRLYRFVNKIVRIIFFCIIIFIVVEGILVGVKLLSHRPNERMCWDKSMCFDYCYNLAYAICLPPDAVDTENPKDAFRLLYMGKRNIVEVLNPNQGYCACQYTVGEENKLNEFYHFYVTH